MSVSEHQIGSFIDSVAGKIRTPASVAGRLLEEAVELGLAAGLSTAEIFGHVADALHNQALKASEKASKTVFPSKLIADSVELPEECADVSLVLKDLCWVAGVKLAEEEERKFEIFKKKTFSVTPSGTVYAVKSHIK